MMSTVFLCSAVGILGVIFIVAFIAITRKCANAQNQEAFEEAMEELGYRDAVSSQMQIIFGKPNLVNSIRTSSELAEAFRKSSNKFSFLCKYFEMRINEETLYALAGCYELAKEAYSLA